MSSFQKTLLEVTDPSGTDTSAWVDIRGYSRVSIQVIGTGTADGTLKLYTSNDGNEIPPRSGKPPEANNRVEETAVTFAQPSGSAGVEMQHLDNVNARFLQVELTVGSGTGDVKVVLFAKGQ